MKRSRGFRVCTRNVLRKDVRDRGIPPLRRTFQRFEIGERANIVIDPSIHKGMPHRRFHGRTCVVSGKRGGCYIVDVKYDKISKHIICRPEHLRKIG